METIHHTDIVRRGSAQWSACHHRKVPDEHSKGNPKRLLKPARRASRMRGTSPELAQYLRGSRTARLALRFILSCTKSLIRDTDGLARGWGCWFTRTHRKPRRSAMRAST